MSKRFIETGLFDDPWFVDLSPESKMLWLYMITKCDHAGMIQLSHKLCSFQTGIKDVDAAIEELGNRLLRVNEHLFFIPKFIYFQYPKFPQSQVKQQESAIKILEKYGLFDKGSLTLSKDLLNSYVNGNVTVSDSVYDSDNEFI